MANKRTGRFVITNNGSGTISSGIVTGVSGEYTGVLGSTNGTDISVEDYLFANIGSGVGMLRWRITSVTASTATTATVDLALDDPVADVTGIPDNAPIAFGSAAICEPEEPNGPSSVPSASQLQIPDSIPAYVNQTNAFYESAGLQPNNDGQYDLENRNVIRAERLSGQGKEIDFGDGFLIGFTGTDGDPFEVGAGTTPNSVVTLSQLENFFQFTQNDDGSCTIQAGNQSKTIASGIDPPSAMMLNAGSVGIGQIIDFDLSSVSAAGDNSELTYSIDQTNPKFSAVTLDADTGVGSINTTGLIAGDMCQITFTVTDGDGFAASNTLIWTQTVPVPAATLVLGSRSKPLRRQNVNVTVQNADGSETLAFFGEDGADISSEFLASGTASNGLLVIPLTQAYENTSLQEVTARVLHPTHGNIGEIVIPIIPPTGTPTHRNVVGDPLTGMTADLHIGEIKVGTVTVGPDNQNAIGVATNNNISTNPLIGTPIEINWMINEGYTNSILNARDLDGLVAVQDTVVIENVSNPNAEITTTGGTGSFTETGTNPITLASTDTSNESNFDLFVECGATTHIRATHIATDNDGVGSTTAVGSLIFRLELICEDAIAEALNAATVTNPLTIASIGDSVGADGVNRETLSARLTAAGIPHEFVGDNTDFGTTAATPTNAWGGESFEFMRTGRTIDRGGTIGVRDEPALNGVQANFTPDILLCMGGNNDTNRPVSSWQPQLELLIDEMETLNVPVVFTNIPQHDNTASGHQRDPTFADNIPGMNVIIEPLIAAETFIKFVDINAVILPADFIADGVHPTDGGQMKIGNAVADAILGV